jgi:hypothetical protein
MRRIPMALDRHVILGVHVRDRVAKAANVQSVFTKHGCIIRSRIGLHPVMGNQCAPGGVILLEVLDDEKEWSALVKDLSALDGVEVQKMLFDHK